MKIDVSEMEEAIKRLNSDSLLRKHIKQAAREVAIICQRELYKRTPKKTGDLARGWYYSNGIRVVPRKNGCQVELVNPVEYARAVNYGHFSHNQFNKGGEPYIVKNRTVMWSAYASDFGDPSSPEPTFVFGHFFVERTKNALDGDNRLIDTIAVNLYNWFEECGNG